MYDARMIADFLSWLIGFTVLIGIWLFGYERGYKDAIRYERPLSTTHRW